MKGKEDSEQEEEETFSQVNFLRPGRSEEEEGDDEEEIHSQANLL